MDSPGAVARPYARAAFAYAKDRGGVAEWSAALAVAAEASASSRMLAALESAEVSEAALKLLIELLEAPVGGEIPGLRNFIRLLLENRRMEALGEIARQFEEFRREDARRVEAVMVSAAPVERAQQQEIARALKARLGREIDFRFELDEGLLGGARIQVGDYVLDGSARAGLSNLASALARPSK